jgi:hypothetical protein
LIDWLVVLEFEVRVSGLPGWCFITWATLPAPATFFFFFKVYRK